MEFGTQVNSIRNQIGAGARSLMARLTATESRTLEALMLSPIGEQALHAVESESVAKRQALIEDLRAIDAALPGDQAAAEARARKTAEHLGVALKAYQAAKEAHKCTVLAGAAVEHMHDQARRKVIDELRSGADPRLDAFVFHADEVRTNDVVLGSALVPNPARLWDRGAPAMLSNYPETAVARDALLGAIEQARALKLAALRYDEITAALHRLCAQLAGPLSALFINPPCLAAGGAEVTYPLQWGGEPRWTSDTNQFDSKEAVAAVREERSRKLASVRT